MAFSISKMLKDGFGAFFKHIGFLAGIVVVTELITLGLPLLFYSFSGDMDNYLCFILQKKPLPFWLPSDALAEAPLLLIILFYICNGLIACFVLAAGCQVALNATEQGCSYWVVLKRCLHPRLLLRLLPFILGIGIFALLAVMLMFGTDAQTFGKYHFTATFAFGFIYGYGLFRYGLGIPHILQGQSFFDAMNMSWKETKRMGASGVTAFAVIVVIALFFSLPTFLAQNLLLCWSRSLLVSLEIYDGFVRMLVLFLALAPWYQVCDHKGLVAKDMHA